MSEFFLASARRLRNDAQSLADADRFQTAGHLIGLSAECTAKAVLERVGISIDAQTGYRAHFPDLGHRLRVLGRTRHMYPLLLVIRSSEFLQGWSVESRYDDDQLEPHARSAYQLWADQADRLHRLAGVMI